jgi:hypothetical protein
MSADWLLLLAYGLGIKPSFYDGPAAGTGSQAVTVVVQGVQRDAVVRAERLGGGVPPEGVSVVLKDPGCGVFAGTLRGEPSRTTQLRLVQTFGSSAPSILYEGLVVLEDRDSDVLAFAIRGSGAPPRAVRIPSTPSSSWDLALDQRVPYLVAWGWGGLCFLVVSGLGTLWAVDRRRGRPE